MRPFLVLLLAAAVTTSVVQAAEPLTAEEFDAYSQGKTLTYSQYGAVFGAEQYLPGRRVRWAFKGNECQDGYWYEDAGLICFVYENDPAAQCWNFWQDTSGLSARYAGDPDGAALSEVESATTPLICAGPDVGA
ncbi:MAG: hypothetical protein U1D06_05145 [Paracoccaceae bacterium]|nr:hypothetical protein [Paracoccaceae bacterium]